MPNSTREIRRRIRSVSSTKKVTKAMELVSSAKMRRAVQAVLSTRAYALRAWDMLVRLGARTTPEAHPLLRAVSKGRVGIVVISTNRGLVGGFNSLLLNALQNFLDRSGIDRNEVDTITLGKRGRSLIVRLGMPNVADFDRSDIVTSADEVRPLAKLITDDFVSGTFGRIILAYTDFVSTINQKPRVRQLLPLEQDTALGHVQGAREEQKSSPDRECLFEPSVDRVLETILPRLIEMQLYQAVLESTASEHAARMVAMRNASDAASDLIDDLTLTFNQARQAGITQDLSEISASRAALEA
ncbi:MAG: ATP synthase F1 subunit gamma [Candidatus Kerfeldbacteria bacterium]